MLEGFLGAFPCHKIRSFESTSLGGMSNSKKKGKKKRHRNSPNTAKQFDDMDKSEEEMFAFLNSKSELVDPKESDTFFNWLARNGAKCDHLEITEFPTTGRCWFDSMAYVDLVEQRNKGTTRHQRRRNNLSK
jgi:hypothetical protein